MLTDLRLLADDGSVRNAGVLLLGREEVLPSVVPAYGYGHQYRPSPGSEATSRFREARPLLAGVEAVVEAVDRLRQLHPLSMAGGVQLQLSDYPRDAVRELVVNAFLHQSHETNGAVEVEHSPERLVVVSPGGLVAGVTPANILTAAPTPRNRLLAEVVATLQIAERTGQGVDRAYREMLRRQGAAGLRRQRDARPRRCCPAASETTRSCDSCPTSPTCGSASVLRPSTPQGLSADRCRAATLTWSFLRAGAGRAGCEHRPDAACGVESGLGGQDEARTPRWYWPPMVSASARQPRSTHVLSIGTLARTWLCSRR